MTNPRSNDSLSRHLAEAIQARIAAEEGRRVLMVRAVLASQWEAGCSMWARRYSTNLRLAGPEPHGRHVHATCEAATAEVIAIGYLTSDMAAVAALPCPADVVAQMLGER